MDFELIFDAFWRPKWMVWGAKMLLKINQKIIEILDAFLRQKVDGIRGTCGSPAECAGCLDSEFA